MKLTDRELTAAAEYARGAMLDTLPDIGEKHEFSPEYERSMAALAASMRRERRTPPLLRAAAMWFIALLLGAALYVTLCPTARAAVLGWTREVIETKITYRFHGGSGEALPYYELTWLPDGFTLTAEEDWGTYRWATYEDAGGEHMIAFQYTLYSEGDVVSYLSTEGIECGTLVINGCDAEIYYSELSPDLHLIWIDEASGIAFTLDGSVSEAELIKAAESVAASNRAE